MIIAVSSSDGLVDSPFSPRFGRCAYFVLFDTSSNSWNTIENPARNAQGGAGTRVVQFLNDLNVEVLVSGRYGPNAFSAIKASGIAAYLADSGTPTELVDMVQAEGLSRLESPSGRGYHG
jgi:predicted Fe-Mo cluster-binding NifX family protein